MKGSKKKKIKSISRRLALKAGALCTAVLVLLSIAGEWFVHHPRRWLAQKIEAWPSIVTAPLLWAGNPVADMTDALGLTGHDCVYEYDEAAPSGKVAFAGYPRRVTGPAPQDIRIFDRGEFVVGWSDTLRHPVWCAYHVVKEAKFEEEKRPSFLLDRSIAKAPRPDDYTRSGYDRGHMVPNHAIVTRYGREAQRKTFLMSNIAPQSPALNRGVWRNVEHRIADLWTKRYGEIWVIVGALPSDCAETLCTRHDIDVPSAYFQLVIAQEGMEIRSLAVVFPQNVGWYAWPSRYIVTVDELEELTGLDFYPELPEFIQSPLEAELPSRLWPVRPWDIFSLLLMRYL